MTDQEKIESLREIMSDFEPTKDPEKINEEFNEMTIGELKETYFEIDGLIAAIKSILEE
jgi:hypothetical protein